MVLGLQDEVEADGGLRDVTYGVRLDVTYVGCRPMWIPEPADEVESGVKECVT